VVVSDAGHDKGRVYLVTDVKGRFAYLADGRTRSADDPKKKRVTHIRILGVTQNAQERTEKLSAAAKTGTKDIKIREIIADFFEAEHKRDQ
jgi:hypothetical protein